MMITRVQLDGGAPVAAELTRDIDTGADIVTLFIGEALTLTMTVATADAIGDALADADAVITLVPNTHHHG